VDVKLVLENSDYALRYHFGLIPEIKEHNNDILG